VSDTREEAWMFDFEVNVEVVAHAMAYLRSLGGSEPSIAAWRASGAQSSDADIAFARGLLQTIGFGERTVLAGDER
jgi:hypothetical protein